MGRAIPPADRVQSIETPEMADGFTMAKAKPTCAIRRVRHGGLPPGFAVPQIKRAAFVLSETARAHARTACRVYARSSENSVKADRAGQSWNLSGVTHRASCLRSLDPPQRRRLRRPAHSAQCPWLSRGMRSPGGSGSDPPRTVPNTDRKVRRRTEASLRPGLHFGFPKPDFAVRGPWLRRRPIHGA